MIWSINGISISLHAFRRLSVRPMSALLGFSFPKGWLWHSMMAAALWSSAFLRIILLAKLAHKDPRPTCLGRRFPWAKPRNRHVAHGLKKSTTDYQHNTSSALAHLWQICRLLPRQDRKALSSPVAAAFRTKTP